MINHIDDILDVKDVARLLGISENTVRYKVKKGYLPDTRIGNKQVFFKRDLAKAGYLHGYESVDDDFIYVEP